MRRQEAVLVVVSALGVGAGAWTAGAQSAGAGSVSIEGVPQQSRAPVGDAVVVIDVRVRDGAITILDTEVVRGAAPKPTASAFDSHHVELLDGSGAVLEVRAWEPHVRLVPPPPLPGEATGAHPEALIERTAIVMPYHPDAVAVRIERPFGLAAARAPIAAAPLPARGDRRPPTPIHATGPDAERMVLLILGDRYRPRDRDRFAADAEAVAEFLLGVKPFRQRRKNINIYRSQTTNGLGCDYRKGADGQDTRLLVCDSSRVIKNAVLDGLSYDEILVLVDSDKYGGSGGAAVGGGGPHTFAVSYNRIRGGASGDGWGAEVSVHELGHSFLGLMDEYRYFSAGSPWGPNCQAPPCRWNAKGLGCHDGCSYDGLARPTDNGCLMKTLTPTGGFAFCKVGLKQARKVLRRY